MAFLLSGAIMIEFLEEIKTIELRRKAVWEATSQEILTPTEGDWIATEKKFPIEFSKV